MLRSRKTLTNLVAASVVLATGLTVLGTAAAMADTPPQTGCPSNGQPGGWLFLSVSDLIAQGYINVGRNATSTPTATSAANPSARRSRTTSVLRSRVASAPSRSSTTSATTT